MSADTRELPSIEDLLKRPAWHRKAACRGAGPDAFFPKRGGATKEGRAMCARCPVIEECLRYAVADEDNVGIWAGTSTAQRRQLRRDELDPPEILAG